MADRTIRKIVRIIVDVLCLAIVYLPHLIIGYDSSVLPFHRGFYCDDENINKPHKSDTVPWKWTLFVAAVLPIVTIAVVEFIHYMHNPARTILPKFVMGRLALNYYLWTVYKFAGLYSFGLGMCLSFAQIGKITVGRLRPHFLTVCQPDLSRVNCSFYVVDDACTGDADLILEARKSFPSGHSVAAFYTMVSTAMYLQCRMPWKSCAVLRHALQAVLVWMAWFTALSRISDYMHHPTDVLAGSVIGTLGAIINVYFVCDQFRPPGERAAAEARASIEQPPSRKISSISRQSRKASKGSMGNIQDAPTELTERDRSYP